MHVKLSWQDSRFMQSPVESVIDASKIYLEDDMYIAIVHCDGIKSHFPIEYLKIFEIHSELDQASINSH